MIKRLIFLLFPLLLLQSASFAQLTVLTSGGFAAPLHELLPGFEKSAGVRVEVLRGSSQGSGPNTIGAQLRRGVAADVVVMSREGLNDLIADSRIVRGSDRDLAQTPLGVAVRAGAAKPDLRSVEAFKQMLLQAKSITFPASTTGLYMMNTLFPRLGVADRISGKITHTGVADVGNGKAEIAIQPVSEILRAPGTEFAGLIPKQIQYVSVFSAALVQGAAQAGAGRRLIAFLGSNQARAALAAHGMELPKSR